jgi:ABC-type antimicrobial peptide transport system permease subunit
MSLVLIGSAVGLLLAAAISGLLEHFLFGLVPLDPITFGGAGVLYAVIGLLACYMPVRNATQIDTMQMLKYE